MSYCQNVVGGAGQGLGGVWRGRWGGRGGGKDEKKEEGEEVKSSKGGGNEVDEMKRKKRKGVRRWGHQRRAIEKVRFTHRKPYHQELFTHFCFIHSNILMTGIYLFIEFLLELNQW